MTGASPTRSGDHRRIPPAPFDPQPVLAGELLTLRPLRAGDLDALAAVAADSRDWVHRTWHPAHHLAGDRDRTAGFARFFREALASGGAMVALDVVDGRVIGASCFHGYHPAAREVAIGGTFLARSHWGGRHHSEMRWLMLTHAFRSVDRVLVRVGPGSVRAQRAVEKLGGVRVNAPSDDPGDSRVVYAISAMAFAATARVRGQT